MLHPDVNKAPDAEARFMETKTAFTVLSDARQRADYDRRLRQGAQGSAWSTAWGAAGPAGRPPQGDSGLNDLGNVVQEVGDWLGKPDWGRLGSSLQDASSNLASWAAQQGQRLGSSAGVEELLRGVGAELGKWSDARKGKAGPLSLLEELAALGEELVEYLEESLGVKEGESGGSSSSSKNGGSDGSSNSRAATSSDGSDEAGSSSAGRASDDNAAGNGAASDGSRSSSAGSRDSRSKASSAEQPSQAPQGPPPSQAKATADDDIDVMLAALKRKLGKQ